MSDTVDWTDRQVIQKDIIRRRKARERIGREVKSLSAKASRHISFENELVERLEFDEAGHNIVISRYGESNDTVMVFIDDDYADIMKMEDVNKYIDERI